MEVASSVGDTEPSDQKENSEEVSTGKKQKRKVEDKASQNGKKRENGKSKPKQMKISEDEIPDELVEIEGLGEDVDGDDSEPGSLEIGREAFEWMIAPITVESFYETYWEKKPLHIKRGDPSFYKTVFSTKTFDKIVRDQRVLYGKNLNVTSFDGKRETHDPEGRVYPAVMWDYYSNGCSLRLLNPQTFNKTVWKLCATLQDHFQSMCGANMYLTPPGTQGFAPHYDDVEVFLVQLEGKKHWKLHESRSPEEKLPKVSSGNFTQEEVGEPMMEFDLEAGDMLYMPRGTIHQGNCFPDQHSLHLTFSCYQMNSWSDFLEKLLPAALELATQEDIEFRRGLPRNFLQVMGVANSENNSTDRAQFMDHAKTLIGKLFNYAPVDDAADQLGKRLMHNILPPHLEEDEKMRCVAGDGEQWNFKKKAVVNRVELDPDTKIRLIRNTAVRLVTEDSVKLYYSTENTREYHEVEEQFLELEEEQAPALEFLINNYPAYVKVEQLPLDNIEDKMKVAGDLWEKKILMTSEPLESKYDDP